jgi:hypothetical protein
MKSMGIRRNLATVIGLGVTLALASCATHVAASTGSPSELLASGVHALAALKTSQVTGTFTVGGNQGSVLASILQNGDITGTLNLDDSDSPFVYAAGTTYFESLATFVTSQFPDVATLAESVKSQPWWRTPGSTDAASVIHLITPSGLTSTFLSGRPQMIEKTATDSSGHSAMRLTDANGSVYVTAASPHNIVEITTPVNGLVGNFSNIKLAFNEFNTPVTLGVPTNVVTPSLAGMPPYYVVNSVTFGICSTTGCTGKAVIDTQAGSGVATVTLTITNPANKTLATCTTTVKATYSANATATCRAHGPNWANFWANVGGSYYFDGVVANPYYNVATS